MRPNLSLVTLGVTDLPRSVQFYEMVGLRVENDWKEQGIAFVNCHGVVLALWSRAELAKDARLPSFAAAPADAASPSQAAGGNGFRDVALAHNARDRPEVDAVIAEADKAGARVLKHPEETSWGGYSGYFADPDGHVWEVAHNPFWTLDAEGRIARLSSG